MTLIMRVWVLLLVCFMTGIACYAQSKSFRNDSLTYALTLHQSSQFHKALPILIALSEKFKANQDVEKFALCQLKIADIIKNYGGVNTAIELLNTNEKFISVRLERPTLVLAQNYLAKAEAFLTALRFSEVKEAVSKSILIKKQIQLPEKEFAEDYFLMAWYYKNSPNQNDSCFYWLNKSLKLAKSDRVYSIYLLPKIYYLLGYYYHPPSVVNFINKYDSMMLHFSISRKYYDSALIAFKEQPIPDELMPARVYHGLGNSFSNEGGIDGNKGLLSKALYYYKRSLKVYEKLGSPSELALKDWVIGRCYERLQLFDSTINQSQLGISRLIPDFHIVGYESLPPLQSTFNNSRFITLVNTKANNFYYKYRKTQELKYLLLAHKHYEYTLRFISYLLNQATNEQELIYWNYLYSTNTYHLLLSTGYDLMQTTNDKSYLIKSYGLIAAGKYSWLNKGDIEPSIGKLIGSAIIKEEVNLVKRNILRGNPNLGKQNLNGIFPSIPATRIIPLLNDIGLSNKMGDSISISSLPVQYPTDYLLPYRNRTLLLRQP